MPHDGVLITRHCKMKRVSTLPQKCLLIVDGDRVLCDWLQESFSSYDYHIICLPDGEGIPEVLRMHTVHMVVLDQTLSGKDGIYWLRWFKHYYSHLPVIMSSKQASAEQRLLGLENGAHDVILKPFHARELLIRIENILKRTTPPQTVQRRLEIGSVIIDTENYLIEKNNQVTRLTQLETQIIKLFYINAGVPLSRDEIARQVRGTKYNPLDRSIDIHINKIRKKIEDNPSQPQYIRTLRGKGYYLHLPEEELLEQTA